MRSDVVSGDTAASASSARTLCQRRSDSAGSVSSVRAAARRCQRAASQRIAGFLPVMRQDPGLLVQPLGAERLDRARNGRVEARAPVGELGLQSHLLSQRMPEGVLRFGVQRALEDELGALEPRERAGQIGRGEVGDALAEWTGGIPCRSAPRSAAAPAPVRRDGRCEPRAPPGRSTESSIPQSSATADSRRGRLRGRRSRRSDRATSSVKNGLPPVRCVDQVR